MRVHLGLDRDDEDLLAEAAALMGTTMAGFVRAAAKDKARALIEQERRDTAIHDCAPDSIAAFPHPNAICASGRVCARLPREGRNCGGVLPPLRLHGLSRRPTDLVPGASTSVPLRTSGSPTAIPPPPARHPAVARTRAWESASRRRAIGRARRRARSPVASTVRCR